MAARKATKPKLKVVENAPEPEVAEDEPRFDVPEYFEGRWKRMFIDLVDEVISIRQVVTPADLTMIETAVSSAQGETEAREFAKEARDEGDQKDYIVMTKLAQSHVRAKAAALSSLQVSGDRRGAGKNARKEMAINNDSVITGGGRSSRWSDLL